MDRSRRRRSHRRGCRGSDYSNFADRCRARHGLKTKRSTLVGCGEASCDRSRVCDDRRRRGDRTEGLDDGSDSESADAQSSKCRADARARLGRRPCSSFGVVLLTLVVRRQSLARPLGPGRAPSPRSTSVLIFRIRARVVWPLADLLSPRDDVFATTRGCRGRYERSDGRLGRFSMSKNRSISTRKPECILSFFPCNLPAKRLGRFRFQVGRQGRGVAGKGEGSRIGGYGRRGERRDGSEVLRVVLWFRL